MTARKPSTQSTLPATLPAPADDSALLVETGPAVDPLEELEETPDAPILQPALGDYIHRILSELSALRADQSALYLEVQTIGTRLDALPDTIAGRILEDMHTVAAIRRNASAREDAALASQDAPDGQETAPDSVGDRQRAIPGETAVALRAAHDIAFTSAGIVAPGSVRCVLARAKRETDPVAYLTGLLARLDANKARSSVLASLGAAAGSGRASSPTMTAVIDRAGARGTVARDHAPTLAWLAATPPGESLCRYSLILHGARTAASLYQEWDANVEAGR